MTGRLVWIVRVAAVAVPLLAAGAARLAGGSWLTAAVSAGVAGLAVYLASRKRTTDEQLADIGRGAIVGMILAFTATWVDHEAAERSARESADAARRSARESLAFTLSSGSSFTGIDLHGRDLSAFYVGGKDFSNADLRGVRLERATLRSSVFLGADLRGANLSKADLRDSDLRGRQTNLTNARLRGATMIAVKLAGARLVDADLRGADLSGAELVGADLRRADLAGAVLVGADLRLALLVDADLRGAVLTADLRDAVLTGAALAGAKVDGRTRWPDGFDLEEHVARTLRPGAPTPVPEPARPDRVARIVDGDTLVLDSLGGVRLLGIDAPTSDVAPVECYGHRATEAATRLLPPGTAVRYVLGNPARDRFGRSLAYVWRSDGTMVNEALVAAGAAHVLISPPNTSYAPQLRRAAVRAASHRRGIWTACE